MKIIKSLFGKTNEGQEVNLFTLANDNQVTVKITNYGAIVTSIETPDQNGKLANIACGFGKLENYLSTEYLGSYPYFGAVCGRDVATVLTKVNLLLLAKITPLP